MMPCQEGPSFSGSLTGDAASCAQVMASMSSKTRVATVALQGQSDRRTAAEQFSLLALDLVASADGSWAALALHQRVEIFSLKSSKHHGCLPVFEVSQRALAPTPKHAFQDCLRTSLADTRICSDEHFGHEAIYRSRGLIAMLLRHPAGRIKSQQGALRQCHALFTFHIPAWIGY